MLSFDLQYWIQMTIQLQFLIFMFLYKIYKKIIKH